jgi:cyanate permease
MKKTEKLIDFYTELLRLQVLVLVAATGGLVGLLFKLDNPIVIPLLIIGLVIETSLILCLVFVILKLKELFRRLKE